MLTQDVSKVEKDPPDGGWTDQEIETFSRRAERFRKAGMDEMAAEQLAQVMLYRDRPESGDDRQVDRTTKWGNPMVVGKHGTREECVKWLAITMNGYITVSLGQDDDGQYIADKLIAYRKHLLHNWRHLEGKNLACWCPRSAPCHADLLLEAVQTLAARRDAKKAVSVEGEARP